MKCYDISFRPLPRQYSSEDSPMILFLVRLPSLILLHLPFCHQKNHQIQNSTSQSKQNTTYPQTNLDRYIIYSWYRDVPQPSIYIYIFLVGSGRDSPMASIPWVQKNHPPTPPTTAAPRSSPPMLVQPMPSLQRLPWLGCQVSSDSNSTVAGTSNLP